MGSTDELYKVNEMNGQGQVTQYRMANGATTDISYLHGLPERFSTSGIQDYNLTYNLASGNIEKRQDLLKNLTENFSYDNKDRLIDAQVNSAPVVKFQYDNNAPFTSPGNLTLKSDVGKYNYGTNPRGAVASIQDPLANGLIPGSSPLIISHGTQEIAYNIYDRVATISEYDNNNTAIQNIQTFQYQEGDRVKSILTTAGINPRVRVYNGSYETQLEAGVLQELHYISTPTGLSLIVVREAGAETNNYIYTDHLGSIVAVTDDAANIIAEQSFDAWGMPRDAQTWVGTPSNTIPNWLYIGYTGHEMMPEFALINMNARLYDYQNARMLQPDALTSAGSQGLNRYSYARNNPILYVDPDGNHPLLVAAAIGAGVSLITNGINNSENNRPFFENGGRAALIGGVSGAISFGIGQAALEMDGLGKHAFQTIAHGSLGGFMSFFNGQSFSSGFASGAIGSIVGGMSAEILKSASPAMRAFGTIASGGVSGGLGSLATGGEFWDGARNGLISAGLNHSFHAIQSAYRNGVYLLYDGKVITAYDSEGNIITSFPATSGLPGFQNSSQQNIPDSGPIPEGTYKVNLKLNPNRIMQVNSNGDAIPGDGIQQIRSTARYSFPGWGTVRARLVPSFGNLFGRNNFYLHDSHKGFSHGCIEVGQGFFPALLAYRGNHTSIKVIVNYPNNNTSTLGGTKY